MRYKRIYILQYSALFSCKKQGYIRKGVDDIRIDLKANERQMIVLGERITRVEESSKQAHKRLDALEKEMNYNG